MTREEKLWSMTGLTLVGVAEKLGITVGKNELKKGKSKLIEKILAAEEMNKQNEKELKKEEPVEEIIGKDMANLLKGTLKDIAKAAEEPVEESEIVEAVETASVEKKAPKKANLKLSELTYKGETKSIKDWAAQIDMPWPTLYDRVNRNGWPVDLAIETPLGQRRPKNKEA